MTAGGADARVEFLDEARERSPYVAVTTDEGSFLLATSDGGTGWGLFVERSRPEFRVLRIVATVIGHLLGRHALAGRVFVDIGANIGTTTVAALVRHGFGSAVACEPEEENYELLRANLVLNDLDWRVRALRIAVSNRSGRADLVVLPDRRGKSWIATDQGRIRASEAARAREVAEDPGIELRRRGGSRPEIGVVEVELATVDQLVRAGAIDADQVGLLWIDTEGHEGQVLDGASELVDRGVPIVLEFNPSGLDLKGDRDRVHEIAERSYTHFIDVRRRKREGPGRLRAVHELRERADQLLATPRPAFTDLLLLRLEDGQARAAADLPELLRQIDA